MEKSFDLIVLLFAALATGGLIGSLAGSYFRTWLGWADRSGHLEVHAFSRVQQNEV
jgi:hypothetical protein